jgi:hypothetical protein
MESKIGQGEQLCFLDKVGYLDSPELLEMGVDRAEEYKSLVRDAGFACTKCGRVAAQAPNLCQPEPL